MNRKTQESGNKERARVGREGGDGDNVHSLDQRLNLSEPLVGLLHIISHEVETPLITVEVLVNDGETGGRHRLDLLVLDVADEGNGGLAASDAIDGGEVDVGGLRSEILQEVGGLPVQVLTVGRQGEGALAGSSSAPELDEARAGGERGSVWLLDDRAIKGNASRFSRLGLLGGEGRHGFMGGRLKMKKGKEVDVEV